MILSQKDIQELLSEKIIQLKKNPSADQVLKVPYIDSGIENIELFLKENRKPTNDELESFRNFGFYAAKEMHDDQELIQTLISEIGSLATRLA